jgi:hypothetical protein
MKIAFNRQTFCWFCIIQAAIGIAILAANAGQSIA